MKKLGCQAYFVCLHRFLEKGQSSINAVTWHQWVHLFYFNTVMRLRRLFHVTAWERRFVEGILTFHRHGVRWRKLLHLMALLSPQENKFVEMNLAMVISWVTVFFYCEVFTPDSEFEPEWKHCVVLLCKTIYAHSAFSHWDVFMGTSEYNTVV